MSEEQAAQQQPSDFVEQGEATNAFGSNFDQCCMQMVQQAECYQDPITGQFVMTTHYVQPTCGGGRFHGELIDINVKPTMKGDLYRLIVKPHNKAVIKGIGSVKVLSSDSNEEFASETSFSGSTIEMDFKSKNGMVVNVEIDWMYNVKTIWPPTILEPVTVDSHKEVHVQVTVK